MESFRRGDCGAPKKPRICRRIFRNFTSQTTLLFNKYG